MTALFTDRQERVRFIKFAIVGTIGAIVDFLVMNLLTRWLGFSLTLAGTISFICAVTSNFIWNRYWTYPDSRSKKLPRQLIMFFVVSVAGIAIRVPILHFVEPPLKNIFHNIGYLNDTPDLLAKNLTLAMAIGIVLIWNYYINRHWTYNDVDKVMK